MSMHSDHHWHDFTRDYDGSMWPAIWVAAFIGGLAVLAWVTS